MKKILLKNRLFIVILFSLFLFTSINMEKVAAIFSDTEYATFNLQTGSLDAEVTINAESATSIVLGQTLLKPGDRGSFGIVVENQGTINGILCVPLPTEIPEFLIVVVHDNCTTVIQPGASHTVLVEWNIPIEITGFSGEEFVLQFIISLIQE